MRSRLLWTAAAVCVAIVAAAALRWPAGAAQPVQPADVDPEAGAALYAEHCASCHGAELEGAADWQTPGDTGRLPPPPHDASGHTWHHGDATLFTYTQLGGREALARRGVEFDSGMPGFGEVLSDREIWNILAFIRSTWPEPVREIQADRTQAEKMYGD